MRVLLGYSGGLDTSWLVAWLTAEHAAEVVACTIDCGGFDAAERAAIAARARQLGAAEHRFVDAREEMFDRVLRWLIAGNVRRGGVYPLSVGAERGLQAEVLARIASSEGFDAIAHGCTAAGNDQVRFDAALHAVAPQLRVLAPVRDRMPSRDQQRAWLQERGLPVPPAGGAYSINQGLWGLTIGGGAMLGSAEPLPDAAWVWTRDGGGTARLAITFADGVPVALDGVSLAPVALIEQLNSRGGGLGVGRGYHLGDTALGIKGRIAFEAPAAELLLTAHRELEKLVLVEEQRFWKDQLGEVYGRRLHLGLFHDPFLRDLEAMFASSQGRVGGEVRLLCTHGRVLVEGLDSPHSLLDASPARYGELADPAAARAAGLGRVLAEPARLHRLAGERAACRAAEVGT
ncbi:MAG TPA: argininosuccinate synthase domain-containing protein [Planctomycetota bacterium]